jgi:hypothetical protein
VPNNLCVNASRTHRYNTFMGNNSIAAHLSDPSQYLTSGTDLAYGWITSSCSQLNNYICALPLSAFTCYPPPSPPKPPPVPPKPPAPFMPPHGAPTPDDYFYCDSCHKACFRMVPTPATFAAAADDCANQGGYLPAYSSQAKQVRWGRACCIQQQAAGSSDLVAACMWVWVWVWV